MKKAIVAIVVVLLAVVYFQRAKLAGMVFERAMDRRMALPPTADPEVLELVLCGAGAPLPDPVRSGPCVLVMAGATQLVIDAGTGGGRNINALGYNPGSTDALLLTHFHSDHIDGLGELAMLRWVGAANTTPVPVHGPQGLAEVVAGFNRAYALDAVYRQAHHGDTVAPLVGNGMTAREFIAPDRGELLRIMEQDDLTVDVLRVDHEPVEPAVAYLIRYRDRSILVSGDTSPSENLQRFAQGVDLLVHEALNERMVAMMQAAAERADNEILARVLADIPDYHTDPVVAAEIARDADVGHLLFYHVVPAMPLPGLAALWLEGVDERFTEHTLGKDGTRVELPVGSDEIRVFP